jgi:hypothetical protein
MIPSEMVNADSQTASKYSEWIARWKKFKGFVTTDPQPWKIDDPDVLLKGKKLWGNLSLLIQSRNELKTQIEVQSQPESFDIRPTDTSLSQDISQAVVELSNRAVALELKHKGIHGSAPASNRGLEQQNTVAFHGTLPWKGSPDAQLVFDILVGFNYRLPTAIAAVAPRFGGELPALARILIEHKHLHGPLCQQHI